MIYILVSAVYTENSSNSMYEFPLQQGSDIWITSFSSDSMLELAFFDHFGPLPQATNVLLLRRAVLPEGQGDALLQRGVWTSSWEWGCEHQPLLKETFKEALQKTTFTNTCRNLESNSLLKTRSFSISRIRKNISQLSGVILLWFGVLFRFFFWRGGGCWFFYFCCVLFVTLLTGLLFFPLVWCFCLFRVFLFVEGEAFCEHSWGGKARMASARVQHQLISSAKCVSIGIWARCCSLNVDTWSNTSQ